MELTPPVDPSKLAKAPWLALAMSLSAPVNATELATFMEPGDTFVMVTLVTVFSFAIMLASRV